MAVVELSIRVLARNTFVVAGLLLLAVGIADLSIGRAKLEEYKAELVEAPAPSPRDRATLFPKVTEAEEQRAVARAKLGYYNLLFLFGQILTLGGLVLVGVGLLRLRRPSIPDLEAARSR